MADPICDLIFQGNHFFLMKTNQIIATYPPSMSSNID